MSAEAVVTVSKVETRQTQRGSVWKMWDHAGVEYATFDGGIGALAVGLSGKQADITFRESTKEKDGRTYTDRYLESIQEHVPTPGEVIQTPGRETGQPDWDVIGLRKTRCALWVAFLQSPLAAQIAAACVPGDNRAHAVYNVGRNLVELAEWDTFTRPNPDPNNDPTVPF